MIVHTVLNNKTEIYSKWLQNNIKNLCDETFTIPATYEYEILEVTERYVARPDILSMDVYGDSIYSDLLCKLNGISNPFELNAGMLLVIPSPDCIMRFMKSVEPDSISDNDSDNNKPSAKQKNSKRKANDAIVGDSRFRIDTNRSIVIY